MFVFLEKVKVLKNECGFEIYVPQDSLRGCWRGTNPAERIPGVFDQDLRDNFENVSRNEAEPGRTIIRMEKDGMISHACLFIGWTSDWKMIVATKNDAFNQPRIMILNDLMKQHPEYGSPAGNAVGETPFYNIKWEAR